MRSLAAALAAVLAIGLFLGADDPKPATAKESDEKAIRALLEELGRRWNAHDMKGFSAHLAEDADVVNRFGMWMKGRAAIQVHLTVLHASPFKDHLIGRAHKVEQVRFLTPDVAMVHERAQEEDGRSVRTYVLQKKDGRWLVQSADIMQEGAPPAH